MNAITRSVTRVVRSSALPKSSRTLTTMTTPLRPTALPCRTTTLAIRPNMTSFTPSSAAAADIVPSEAITTNPALGSIRCGPRNTMNGHTRLVQKRRHGWLVRKRSKSGRKILLRRKIKGRRQVAH